MTVRICYREKEYITRFIVSYDIQFFFQQIILKKSHVVKNYNITNLLLYRTWLANIYLKIKLNITLESMDEVSQNSIYRMQGLTHAKYPIPNIIITFVTSQILLITWL